MKNREGCLFVVSAPSGAGKTTLCRELLSLDPALYYSVSYTTREKRSGERAGVDYHYIPHSEFERRIREGAMAEWAEVHGRLYGTPRAELDAVLQSGLDILLDVDVQGFRQLRNLYAGAVAVFILPPSLEVLEQRLRSRAQDPPEVIQARLAAAKAEIGSAREFDYAVVNHEMQTAVNELVCIVKASRCRIRNALLLIEEMAGA